MQCRFRPHRIHTGIMLMQLFLSPLLGCFRPFQIYLFRPFRSTKKKGMGIGLFHSKMIVEAHRGKIEVESEEGKGSTFRVVLPLGGKETVEWRRKDYPGDAESIVKITEKK